VKAFSSEALAQSLVLENARQIASRTARLTPAIHGNNRAITSISVEEDWWHTPVYGIEIDSGVRRACVLGRIVQRGVLAHGETRMWFGRLVRRDIDVGECVGNLLSYIHQMIALTTPVFSFETPQSCQSQGVSANRGQVTTIEDGNDVIEVAGSSPAHNGRNDLISILVPSAMIPSTYGGTSIDEQGSSDNLAGSAHVVSRMDGAHLRKILKCSPQV
jgi:hypothetical protein